ncbi:MAG TPA: hypothetical protein VGQ46_15760 [Thermoanaerobaculia bacterium]|jgi:hypothetical protein|nr:hypothetical protein [Thermoanaerobaculia bacterium]
MRLTTIRRERYLILLWCYAAIMTASIYALQQRLGGRLTRRDILWETFTLLEWAALTPVVVHFARLFPPSRALRAIAFHVPAAISFAFLALVIHKLGLCYPEVYLDCVLSYGVELWIVAWLLRGAAIYTGTLLGVWILDAADAAKANDVAASRMAAELAGAELRLTRARVVPEAIVEAFDTLLARLDGDPHGAETMITTLADQLRASVATLSPEDSS